MIVVPPIVAGLSGSSSLTAVAPAIGTAMTPIQVAVADATQALQNLGRSIQTTATVAAPPVGNLVTLIVPNGSVTIDLSQVASSLQQTLLQQLTDLAQSQRSIVLGLGAGSPPTQAVLVLSNIAVSAPPPSISQTPSPSALPSLSDLTGQSFVAIVLPSTTTPTTLLPPLNTSLSPVAIESGLIAAAPLSSSAATSANPLIPPTVLSAPPPPTSLINELPSLQANSPLATASSAGSVPTPATPPANMPLPLPNTASQSGEALPLPPAQTAPLAPAPSEAQAPSISASALSSANNAPSTLQNITGVQPAQELVDTLAPGNEVSLRIDAVYPAGTALPTMLALASNQLLATVIAAGTDGQLVLKADDTSFFTKTQATAPVGSAVLIALDITKGDALVTLPSSEPTSFQALPQALASLAQTDPQVLQQLFDTRIPQAADSLPGALLFLVSAFKQGNVRGWLGDDAVDSLIKAGKAGLVENLASELINAGQPSQDAIVGDWKSFPIPLYSNHNFQTLSLFVHNDRDRQNQENSAAGKIVSKVRFVIDMRLSKLGAMQIDGFFQPKQLDMILRSESILPDGLHNELRSAYIKAIEAVGYAGSLNFQVGRQSWLRMDQQSSQNVFR